jgi:hypothetical protein
MAVIMTLVLCLICAFHLTAFYRSLRCAHHRRAFFTNLPDVLVICGAPGRERVGVGKARAAVGVMAHLVTLDLGPNLRAHMAPIKEEEYGVLDRAER